MSTAKKIASLEEFRKLPESERAEIIDGEVHPKAFPSGKHANVEGAILSVLFQKFRMGGSDGPGGWWIMPEVSIYYPSFGSPGRILTADIAGWMKSRVPNVPEDYPVEIRPDWVCEVSLSTFKKDSTIVPETLAREGVPFYWLVDLANECILVHELKDLGYFVTQKIFADDGMVRIAPFEEEELDAGLLLGKK